MSIRMLLASILLLVMSVPAPSFGNTGDEAAMMATARGHYNEGGYYYATTWLERVLKNYPNTSRREEVLLMMAKAYVATAREEKARQTVAKLQKDFPQSLGKLDPVVVKFMEESKSGGYSSPYSTDEPVAAPAAPGAKQTPVQPAPGSQAAKPAAPASAATAGVSVPPVAVPVPAPIAAPVPVPVPVPVPQAAAKAPAPTPAPPVAPKAAEVKAAVKVDNPDTVTSPAAQPVAGEGAVAEAPKRAPAKTDAPPAPVEAKGPAKAKEAAPASVPAPVAEETAAAASPRPVPAPAPSAPISVDEKEPPQAAGAAPAATPAAKPVDEIKEVVEAPKALPAPAKPVAPAEAAEQAPARIEVPVPVAVVKPAAEDVVAADAPNPTAEPVLPAASAPVVAKRAAKAKAPAQAAPAKAVTKPGKGAEKLASSTCQAGSYVIELGDYVGQNFLVAAKKAVRKAGLLPVVGKGPVKEEMMLRIQVGQFRDQGAAQKLVDKLRAAKADHFVLQDKTGTFRVFAGSYVDLAAAAKEQERLSAKGLESELKEVTVPVSTSALSAGCFSSEEGAREKLAELEKLGLKGKVAAAP